MYCIDYDNTNFDVSVNIFINFRILLVFNLILINLKFLCFFFFIYIKIINN